MLVFEARIVFENLAAKKKKKFTECKRGILRGFICYRITFEQGGISSLQKNDVSLKFWVDHWMSGLFSSLLFSAAWKSAITFVWLNYGLCKAQNLSGSLFSSDGGIELVLIGPV